jgi:hypothetical protein
LELLELLLLLLLLLEPQSLRVASPEMEMLVPPTGSAIPHPDVPVIVPDHENG